MKVRRWPVRARAVHRDPRGNRTEQAYGRLLQIRKEAGEVAWYAFESVKLRLADRTYYTPDFFVVLANGECECHEVKGFMRDDAAVKIKTAADIYPFRFLLVRRTRGDWSIKEV